MVYADVLIFVNLIINYFLLLAVSKIRGKAPKTLRIVFSSFLGALSSLYIFLPPLSALLEVIFKIAVSVIMTLSAFGYSGIKSFLKNVLLLFVITLGFGGLIYAIWLIFKPYGMVINNSVVYFDISLIALLVFSVVGYLIFTIAFKIFSKSTPLAEECEVIVFANEKSIKLNGIIDTGNSIQDVFMMGDIIICNKQAAELLFEEVNLNSSVALKTRYRLLPCSTVAGNEMLEGMRCDSAEIKYKGKKIKLNKPIMAFSKTQLEENYAIINPKILG